MIQDSSNPLHHRFPSSFLGIRPERYSYSPRLSTSSSTMSSLLGLTYDVALKLMEWLDVRSLSSLDVAATNLIERPRWLSYLAAMQKSDALNKWIFYDSAASWLSKRAICPRNLHSANSHQKLFSEIDISELQSITIGSKDPRCYRNITDSDLNFALRCPNLVVVCLNYCRLITDVGVATIARACPRLLSISLCATNVTDVGMRILSEGCNALNTINIDHTEASDEGLSFISSGCPQLVSISLVDCCAVTFVGINALAEGCPLLQSIVLDGLDKITDAGIRSIGNRCPQLHSISLNGCRGIRFPGMNAVANGCPLLQSISMDGCCWVTDESLKALGIGCPNLHHISVNHSKVTDSILLVISARCPNLQSISLDECASVSDIGVGAIIRECTGLRSISLNYTNVTDDVVYGIIDTCPALLSIKLDGCQNVTDAALAALGRGPNKLLTIVSDRQNSFFKAM